MTREELEMRTLVRESDVIDRTDRSELAKAFNYLWEKYIEQEPSNVLPDNPTNGDMIETMFPNCVKDNDFCGAVITSLNGETQYWKSDWWNSPYKGGRDAERQKCDTCYHNETEFSICQYCTGGDKYVEDRDIEIIMPEATTYVDPIPDESIHTIDFANGYDYCKNTMKKEIHKLFEDTENGTAGEFIRGWNLALTKVLEVMESEVSDEKGQRKRS